MFDLLFHKCPGNQFPPVTSCWFLSSTLLRSEDTDEFMGTLTLYTCGDGQSELIFECSIKSVDTQLGSLAEHLESW